MDFIIDAITEWIKDFLIEAITGNLSNMFGDVNTKVATIAGEVGKTPEQWNSGVFSMIHSLSESVIVPIAGLVIAAVLSYELIRMVIDRNNMHDFDTFIFFKWIIKAGIAAYVVSHTFDFIIAIFEVAQTMVQQSAGVIDANASIDISSALASITTELEAKGLGELFALMLETWVVSFAMTVMGALITIILYGRMIEIYIYASVGPLPFATLANHEWGNIGTNYIRGLVTGGELIGPCEHHKGLDRGQKQGRVWPDPATAYLFCTGCAGGCSYLLFDPEKPGQRYCLDSSDCYGSALFLLRPLRKERADTGKDA